ncbi:MAG: UvrD-helicase domain-containing protein [Prevotellaceae bacterium]|jgi:ATP-dependent exoDNAse (exonuclease V) beta subunit|nr:UvrD-helicase domain-containing protein [Prevotellaceae bacterium]
MSKSDYTDIFASPHKGLTIYGASAGSGKTYILTLEYLKRALSGIYSAGRFREILAVTFTNKATDEMKSRIINTLHSIITGSEDEIADSIRWELGIDRYTLNNRASRVQNAILHDYSNFSILTIDKFFQKILHAFVREAGLHPGFRLELDQERLMDEAIDRMMLNIHKNEFLYRRISNIIDEQMEKGYNWDIRKTLKDWGSEVLKEQFRGFGSSFHEKIRDADFMDRFTAEITATGDAFENTLSTIAATAVAAINAAELQISDFPYGKNGAVNYFYKLKEGRYEAPGKRVYNILYKDSDDRWVTAGLPAAVKDKIRQISGVLTDLLMQVVDFYEKNCRRYFTAVCVKKAMEVLSFFAEIETGIRETANEENLMPISETTHLLEKLINETDTPFIYEKAGTRYGIFMIDEFQDTSEAQWRNFKPLLKNSLAEGKNSLVVGDVKQSIYRWRNGDWRILAHKIFEDFKDFTITERNLDTNWRSFPNVVEFNNALFSALPAYIEKEFMKSFDPPDADNEINMLSAAYKNAKQGIASINQDRSGYVSVALIRDDKDAKAKDKILEQLPALIADMQDRGYKAKEIAVLVRQTADGQAVSDCLLDYRRTSGDTEHCFEILSQDTLFLKKSATVQFIIAILRAVINPDDKINNASINYFVNRNNPGFKWDSSGILDDSTRKKLSIMTSLSLPEVFERIVEMFDLGNDPVEIPYIQELHEQLISFSTGDISDISSFTAYWDDKSDKMKLSEGQTPNAINITTIHKAKGLEYPVVIVPFCNWSMKPSHSDTVWVSPEEEPFSQLPHIPVNYGIAMKNSFFDREYYSETVHSLVDNLNLLYVAFTRAKEELHVMLPVPPVPKNRDSKSDNIRTAASTLADFLENNPNFIPEKSQKNRLSDEDDCRCVFGEKQYRQKSSEEETFSGILITNYNSSVFDKKLRIKYESENYSPKPAAPLQLRNYGIRMHRVFSLIRSIKDVPAAIDSMEEDGLIGKEHVPELRNRVEKALLFAKEWFADENRYEIITEKFLLLPASMKQGLGRRPDRIMSSENETIVIDYKFGAEKKKSHKTQVKNYIRLLELMKYPNVKGYVWYVDMDSIENVR